MIKIAIFILIIIQITSLKGYSEGKLLRKLRLGTLDVNGVFIETLRAGDFIYFELISSPDVDNLDIKLFFRSNKGGTIFVRPDDEKLILATTINLNGKGPEYEIFGKSKMKKIIKLMHKIPDKDLIPVRVLLEVSDKDSKLKTGINVSTTRHYLERWWNLILNVKGVYDRILSLSNIIRGTEGIIAKIDVKTQERVPILISEEGIFSQPQFTHDGKDILFVYQKEKGRKEIYITANRSYDVKKEDDKMKMLTTGHSPFRLPDNESIIYLDSERLHVLGLRTKKKVILSVIAEKILGISTLKSNSCDVVIIRSDSGAYEIFLVELQISPISVTQIRHLHFNHSWFYSSGLHPSEEKIVSGTKNGNILIIYKNSDNKEVISENYFDSQPAWSVDGREIVFITRPHF